MITMDVPQYSDEWWSARTGIPSASCFDKIVTSRGAPSKQRTNYLYQLAGERIAGAKVETYQSAAMERGVALEEEARKLFELTHDVEVRQVGLCYFDERKRFSCSPDGLMAYAGLEIKCPLIHTHVGYILDGKLPTDYVQQVQGSMLVTGLPLWWFLSYYPGLPPLVVEVEMDFKFTSALKVELDEFCDELDDLEAKLRKLA